ncbi:MAG: 3-dehydroquinate synthase [Deltaproteobacteria bacterium]|nr:MAG: 3-dehydroquinate synthase [Deltaproteobacteria bacterium]
MTRFSIDVEPGRPAATVEVGAGIAGSAGDVARRLRPSATRAFVVTDATVEELHVPMVERALRGAGLTTTVHAFPPGERHKTPETLVSIVRAMVRSGLGRGDLVVAVGGGVVGDVAGLAAAVFMRGVAWMAIPTTLLAQVDASVGGKTAVDLPEGKNLFGVFHVPEAVLVDPALLSTLPEPEWICGRAEMVKHGLLFDPDHLGALRRVLGTPAERDPGVLAPLVARQIELKLGCIRGDLRESAPIRGGRALLNLGHTVAHAFETLSGHTLRHGEAVARGLVAAARISERLGVASPGFEAEVREVLEAVRLPVDLDGMLARYDDEALADALSSDKKRQGTTIPYIVLRGIGRPDVVALPPGRIVDLLRGPASAR